MIMYYLFANVERVLPIYARRGLCAVHISEPHEDGALQY